MQSIKKKLLDRIYGHGRGYAFTGKDFWHLSSPISVDKALSLLAREGVIRRLGRGLYDYPRVNPELGGPLTPDFHQVAQAIARKLGIRVQPDGAWASNLIGISTQVPAKIVYLTDGRPQKYRIGNQILDFRKAAPGKFRPRDPVVGLIASALRDLGPKAIDRPMLDRLSELLSGRNRRLVLRDAQYVEGWIGDIIRRAAAEQDNQR